ncbi:hypothetical protein EYF80_013858 [Liparis tanakae]|uniref:Uncharacterized protein n=1 Tax=Liparis tanakae TaxID=230148 RepID=A0A4Z2ID32_9TELE|nr:hypothetical protein EYF80_013858 [Liparis tanakae]
MVAHAEPSSPETKEKPMMNVDFLWECGSEKDIRSRLAPAAPPRCPSPFPRDGGPGWMELSPRYPATPFTLSRLPGGFVKNNKWVDFLPLHANMLTKTKTKMKLATGCRGKTHWASASG